MSDILKQAIASLTSVVNVTTGLAHPFDEARAKELFKALRAEGVQLRFEEIRNLALENNWPAKHAAALGKLGERIGEGGRVQIKHPRGWGEPTVAKIKQGLSVSE